MKKRLSTLLISSLLSATPALASHGAAWGYSGAGAPENWATLSEDFAACSGKNQSPINLTGFVEAELAPVQLDYQAGGNEIINNGHSVQVNIAPGSTLTMNGKKYMLRQFHFHTPGENTIEGRSFPMEMHLVHTDADGNIAVIGVMFEEGKTSDGLAQFWEKMPQHVGGKATLTPTVTAAEILPQSLDYYRFNGSLTTPPCSEGVRWLILKTPLTASAEQIKKFSELMGGPNNRPLQQVNARPVLQ